MPAVDEGFVGTVADLIRRVAAEQPPVRVPSARECGFRPIGASECPERVEARTAAGVTAEF